MRSSISCDSCRKAKVKCIHTGTSPCKRCQKTSISGCVLTRPTLAITKTTVARVKRLNGENIPASPMSNPSQDLHTHSSSSKSSERRLQGESSDTKLGIEDHIVKLPTSVILESVKVFINKFPELGFLHLPTILKKIQESPLPKQTYLLLSAVLAVTRAQATVQASSWTNDLLPREHYATYVRDTLSEFILEPPNVEIVQILLIITLYEWGSRNFHKAWVYCGIAIRIMQALRSVRVSPFPLEPNTSHAPCDPSSQAIEVRTYWACYIMDCMVNSGTYNPPMLPMLEMINLKIRRPPSAMEFAFGPQAATSPDSSSGLDITQSFEILVGGFEVWWQVQCLILKDGRRAPGMCAPQNCPWSPTSPWYIAKAKLETWRAGQHAQLHFPRTSVAVHMTLGYGETYTYLNLLYYISVLSLQREYTPFLPTPESVPQGPVDHPLLEAEAPGGFWDESSGELFRAAEHIADLLREASECGVHLMTPFVGFCAFSAGYLSTYHHWFPRMNLMRSPRGEECAKVCIQYLEDLKHVWNIADGWIKTIQHASLLYERAATTGRYRGRTRHDFDTLNQSAHEFRVVDRSDVHSQEIDRATAAGPPVFAVSEDAVLDAETLLSQFMAEVSNNVEEQGPWSQWWPPIEEVDLSTILL